MTTITFDTMQLVNKLKLSGLSADQAESIVAAIVESQHQLVTRDHFDAQLDSRFSTVNTELAVIKWMLGVIVGGIVALLIKSFT